jgi:murein DD-endopeptidase MepM/ murein hydrolase activator NlpD
MKKNSILWMGVFLAVAAVIFTNAGTALGQQNAENTHLTPAVAKAADKPSVKKFVLHMPLIGHISSLFGSYRGNHCHSGVDIAAHFGTPIEAAAAGTVIFAGWQSGYGNTILIEHEDGWITRYAHAASLLVSVGDVVDDGEQIATVGSSGRSTGAHCHFEVIRNGRCINPLSVIEQPSNDDESGENISSYKAEAE